MAIIYEERNGIKIRYLNAQDGIRVYLLPNVPVDVGEIPTEKDFDLESAVNHFLEIRQDKARIIGKQYSGRQLDAMSILLYAEEQGKFDEYAEKLESKLEDFKFIHPGLRMARTDINAFFMQLYFELGIAPESHAVDAKKLVDNYGPGVIVLPKNNKAIK